MLHVNIWNNSYYFTGDYYGRFKRNMDWIEAAMGMLSFYDLTIPSITTNTVSSAK